MAKNRMHSWEIDPQGVLSCRVCPGIRTTDVLGEVAWQFRMPAQELKILEQVEPTAMEPRGALYELLQEAARTFGLPATACPFCTPGNSDNRFIRAAGIPTFGLFPLSVEELVKQHHPDERMTVASLERAIRILYQVTQSFIGL